MHAHIHAHTHAHTYVNSYAHTYAHANLPQAVGALAPSQQAAVVVIRAQRGASSAGSSAAATARRKLQRLKASPDSCKHTGSVSGCRLRQHLRSTGVQSSPSAWAGCADSTTVSSKIRECS